MQMLPVLFSLTLLSATALGLAPQAQSQPSGFVPNQGNTQVEVPGAYSDPDTQWARTGGTRPYWDDVRATPELDPNWKDPALVPPLNVAQLQPGKKAVSQRAKKPVAKAAKRSKRKKAAAARPAPLPANEDIPALSPKQKEERWIDSRTDSPFIEPPRLQ